MLFSSTHFLFLAALVLICFTSLSEGVLSAGDNSSDATDLSLSFGSTLHTMQALDSNNSKRKGIEEDRGRASSKQEDTADKAEEQAEPVANADSTQDELAKKGNEQPALAQKICYDISSTTLKQTSSLFGEHYYQLDTNRLVTAREVALLDNIYVLTFYNVCNGELRKESGPSEIFVDLLEPTSCKFLNMGAYYAAGEHATIHVSYSCKEDLFIYTWTLNKETIRADFCTKVARVMLSPDGNILVAQSRRGFVFFSFSKSHNDPALVKEKKFEVIYAYREDVSERKLLFSHDSSSLLVYWGQHSHFVIIHLSINKALAFQGKVFRALFSNDDKQLLVETGTDEARIYALYARSSNGLYEPVSEPKLWVNRLFKAAFFPVYFDNEIFIVTRQRSSSLMPLTIRKNDDSNRAESCNPAEPSCPPAPPKYHYKVQFLYLDETGVLLEYTVQRRSSCEGSKPEREGSSSYFTVLPVLKLEQIEEEKAKEMVSFEDKMAAGTYLYLQTTDFFVMAKKIADASTWILSFHNTDGALIEGKELYVDKLTSRSKFPIVEGMYFSPGKHAMVYAWYSFRYNKHLITWTLNGATKEIFTEGSLFRVLLSPDGNFMAMQHKDSYDIVDFTLVKVHNEPNVHSQQHFAFSPDSFLLIVCSPQASHFVIIDLLAKERKMYPGTIVAPLFSNDSSLLLYMHYDHKLKSVQEYSFHRRIYDAEYKRASSLDSLGIALKSEGSIPLRIEASLLFYDSVFGPEYTSVDDVIKADSITPIPTDEELSKRILFHQKTPDHMLVRGVDKTIQALTKRCLKTGKVVKAQEFRRRQLRTGGACAFPIFNHVSDTYKSSPQPLVSKHVSRKASAFRDVSEMIDSTSPLTAAESGAPRLKRISSFQLPPGKLHAVLDDYFIMIEHERPSFYSIYTGEPYEAKRFRGGRVVSKTRIKHTVCYSSLGINTEAYISNAARGHPKLIWTRKGKRPVEKEMRRRIFGLDLSLNERYLMLKTRNSFWIYNRELKPLWTIDKLPSEYKGDLELGSYEFGFSPDSSLALLYSSTHYFVIDFNANEMKMYEGSSSPALLSQDSKVLFYRHNAYGGRFLRWTSGVTFEYPTEFADLEFGPLLSPVYLDIRHGILFVVKEATLRYISLKGTGSRKPGSILLVSSDDLAYSDVANADSVIHFDRRFRTILYKTTSSSGAGVDNAVVYRLCFGGEKCKTKEPVSPSEEVY